MKLALTILPLLMVSLHFPYLKAAAIKENSLYDAADPIVLLNVKNFKDTIVNTPYAWLVEFYSSWCGHCISFAPLFKQLAANVSSWSRVMTVGAIDCAQDENGPICREYEVMAYPTLKFFPAYSNSTFLGIQWKGTKTVEKMKTDMINFIEEQREQNNLSHFPNLRPVGNQSLENIWSTLPESVEMLLLIFEATGESTTWSREVILDLTQFDNFPPVRRVGVNRQDLINKFNIKSLPAIAAVSRKGLVKLTSIKPDRFGTVDFLIKHYSGKKVLMESSTNGISSDVVETKERNEVKALKKDQVHMIDLEKAIQYSLGHEVQLHKMISGESFQALKDFITVLTEYFPGRPQVMRLLKNLQHKVEALPETITGEGFSVLWTELRKEAIPSWAEETADWRGCKGSQPNRRGYPCSLWSLFHTLTVNHASKGGSNPQLVLQTMKKYIRNFFGCAECAKHFLAMAEDPENSIDKRVDSDKTAVLWLWEAHNKANKRLSGDPSEDPDHPKIQFPSTWNCPSCKDVNGHFNKDEVYNYLMNLYGIENISVDGLPSSADSGSEVPLSSSAVSMHRISWGPLVFTGFDISLCVLLYVSSCFILFFVLYKFVVKRRHRKRPSDSYKKV